MPRPGRLYPGLNTQPAYVAARLINVNYVIEMTVAQNTNPDPNDPTSMKWILRLGFMNGTADQQVFNTQEEALAAADVWRARVDDAP